jgi:hypothetical protein
METINLNQEQLYIILQLTLNDAKDDVLNSLRVKISNPFVNFLSEYFHNEMISICARYGIHHNNYGDICTRICNTINNKIKPRIDREINSIIDNISDDALLDFEKSANHFHKIYGTMKNNQKDDLTYSDEKHEMVISNCDENIFVKRFEY